MLGGMWRWRVALALLTVGLLVWLVLAGPLGALPALVLVAWAVSGVLALAPVRVLLARKLRVRRLRRGSWRVVRVVKPLAKRLREAWIARGRPSRGKVCPPRQYSPSGMLDLGYVQVREHREWRALGLEPIGLHESRHTAATWLDHAGVSPKVASTLMGHKTPEYQPGAASITLRRYTHTLPGELERARDLLDRFLVDRTQQPKRARK